MSKIREYNLNSTHSKAIGANQKVLFIIEDTGNAFNLYKDYLHRNFEISDADIIGIGGADIFIKEVKNRLQYTHYIVIYDAGVELKKINKINNAIQYLKSINSTAGIYTYTPQCFEEILLSFSELKYYINSKVKKRGEYKVFQDLQLYLDGTIIEMDYFSYDNKIESKEQKIERILEVLVADTPFKYEHFNKIKRKSLMSDCWLYDCCNIDKTIDKNRHLINFENKCRKINLTDYNNKLDLIAHTSLLGGLTNIVSEVFNLKNARLLTKLADYDNLVRRL